MKKMSLTQKILEKNYIIFIISVVISISIWVYMSMNAANDTTVTVSNVPIQVELSDSVKALGLEVFTGADEPTSSVTVTGNRTILGSVTASDITVTASSNSVSSTGNFTLPVSAAKTNPSSSFQITNSTPSSINVVVDYFKESTFPIQDGVILNVKKGYYGITSLPYNQITISGPQTEVMKIKKVIARASIDRELTESVDVDANIVLLDENDNELSTQLLTMSFKTLTANVSVLPEKNVQLKPVFINKPSGLAISDDMITIEPSEILIAGPRDTLSKLESVNLEAIDFSKLDNSTTVFDSLAIEVPDQCKSISNTSTAKVTLDLSSLSKKEFDVDTFTVTGLSGEYNSEVTSKSVKVVVIGPKDDLDSLTEEQITAVIDTSNAAGKIGSVEMPVTFKFNGTTKCWAYGSYQANLTISEK